MTSTASDDATPDESLSEEEQQELIEELERRRSPRGVAAVAVAVTAVAFSAYQLWIAGRGFEFAAPIPGFGTVELASLQLLQANAIHVTFALLLAFLLYPPSTGEGAIAQRLGRVVPALSRRFGEDHPATGTGRRVRGAVRWLAVDAGRERVTPLDVVFMALAVLAGSYMITDFDEIQTLRALGIDSGRTLGEIVAGFGQTAIDILPVIEPLVQAISVLGVPFGESSYAYLLGVVGVLLVLEATRRTLGVFLTAIVGAFIVYAKYGTLIPQNAPYVGVLSTSSLQWNAIIQNLWYNTENGVFGIPVTVSIQFIYIFILFGAFLEMSGAGQWFIDLAYGATGERKGGPAKSSILASGFMGTISGSSIANTVTTGAFTIPLMKRSGYRPSFAGAVEASASSGGQILPPVMGAAAFLIVEYTGTPYSDVIVAAAIPAIVFFFGVWVMVHLEASRAGIGGLGPEDVVSFGPHLRGGWFYLVPLALLLYYLIVARLAVARSAWFTIVAIVALIALVAVYNDRTRLPLLAVIGGLFAAETAAYLVAGTDIAGVLSGGGAAGLAPATALGAAAGKLGWIIIAVSALTLLLRPHTDAPLLDYDTQVDDAAATLSRGSGLADNGAFRLLTFVGKSMESGARTATPVVVAVAVAGIIPGVIGVTGLGPNLVSLILAVAGGSVVLLLLITAIASIILGMGMPTTITYIILVSILAPALAGFGLPELASHLFILYFGVIADITPPVAVAAYAASGIAKSEPFETGVEAFSLSLNKAIVPFAFVLVPGVVLLRRKPNAASLDPGEKYRVLDFADVLDLGYFLPEVVVPIAGVFVGVIALGATVIGYLYSDVNRIERALYALSALLLMAPGIVLNALPGAVGTGGPGVSSALAFDLVLRAAGLALFVLLTTKNRRAAQTGTATPEAA